MSKQPIIIPVIYNFSMAAMVNPAQSAVATCFSSMTTNVSIISSISNIFWVVFFFQVNATLIEFHHE